MTATDFIALQEALLGRYSLERELGRGGMGVVYLAHEVALDRPVALKLLPPGMAVRPELRERFLREARTAAKLSHPNIVPIFAVDEVEGFVFFAMAYIDGETLGARIRERGAISRTEAATVLQQVAWALAYAHTQGVVHRDIKPDNVLLETGGSRALVADFGIAHLREQSGLTGAGEIVGTAEFMSPEQASGDAVDARSDIYALGVLGYYMLSGRLPFEADTVRGMLAKHLTQPAPPLRDVSPETPRRLAAVIDKCLHKDASDRFPDGHALAEAVGGAMEERRELPIPLRVFIKRNRDSFRAMRGITVFAGFFVVPSMITAVVEGEIGALAFALAVAGITLSAPLMFAVSAARQLVKSGFGLDDAVLAWKRDLETQREELAFEFGTRASLVERIAQGITFTAIGAFGLGVVGGWLGFLRVDVWMPMLVLSSTLGLGAGLIAATRFENRTDIAGERRRRLWSGRVGKWLFKLAGTWVKRKPIAGPATFRPTELAIGLAADRLFEELPKAMQTQLGELPEIVRQLETDAQHMRARVDELNELIGQVGRVSGTHAVAAGGGSALSARRGELADQLTTSRDAAQRRLTEAVTALETIRLDLLRLTAGAGSVESISSTIGSAQDLLSDIRRLREGESEIESLLRS